jgi:hypothetical protein
MRSKTFIFTQKDVNIVVVSLDEILILGKSRSENDFYIEFGLGHAWLEPNFMD